MLGEETQTFKLSTRYTKLDFSGEISTLKRLITNLQRLLSKLKVETATD